MKWSITEPAAELAPGFEGADATKMDPTYGQVLSATELDDLSAYVLSLK